MDAGSGMKEKRVTGTIVQSSRRIWPRRAASYFYTTSQVSLSSDHELLESVTMEMMYLQRRRMTVAKPKTRGDPN